MLIAGMESRIAGTGSENEFAHNGPGEARADCSSHLYAKAAPRDEGEPNSVGWSWAMRVLVVDDAELGPPHSFGGLKSAM